MGSLTVRNLPDNIHNRLRQNAKQNGRSAEEEVRTIITASVMKSGGVGLGAELRALWGDDLGGEFDPKRSTVAPRKVAFE